MKIPLFFCLTTILCCCIIHATQGDTEMYKFNSNEPIYLQLIMIIKQQIINGTLKENDKIKSVRELALEYGVNPNTAQKSLSELEREGYIHTERTSGRYVALTKEKMEEFRQESAEAKTDEYIREMKNLKFTADQIISLIAVKIGKTGGKK